ncbi:helix-turn-helix domain-containing protein [Azospirillum sp. 11R-A]|uniref:helix-turn-helix domain-containing protein n=1 Tax=Azospirillum sp. 11R-A TaxID=3111634 RepID=UPI003C2F6EBF
MCGNIRLSVRLWTNSALSRSEANCERPPSNFGNVLESKRLIAGSLEVPEWIPEDLKAWRVRLGMTQASTADASGISRRLYIDREKPKARISRETVMAYLHLEQQTDRG